MEALEKYLEMALNINYENREGGRYAYVQLMVCLREIRNVLVDQGGHEASVKRLEEMSDELNELVPQRFEAMHRVVFDGQKNELQQLIQRFSCLGESPLLELIQMKGCA